MSRLSDLYKDFFHILEDLRKTRENPTSGDDGEEFQEKQENAFLCFLLFKDTNRREKWASHNQKESVMNIKSHLDTEIFQYQNLLYMLNHLERKIYSAQQLKSADEDLNLLTSYEYTNYLNVNVPDYQASTDRRTLLKNENLLRKQLAKECDQLLEEQESVSRQISAQEELTASVPSLMRKLKKAAAPLQEIFGVPLVELWQLRISAYSLPLPLRLCFMKIQSLSSAYDETQLAVNVVNETDEANNNNSCMDSSKRTSRSSKSNQSNGDRNYLFQAHPFSLNVSIGPQEEQNKKLNLKIRFFPKLGFCTAHSEHYLSNADADLISASNILIDLFPDDSGNEVLFCDSEYESTTENGESDENCIKYFIDNDLGRPYKWVQHVCGIKNYEEDYDNFGKYTEFTLIDIMYLWESRLKLLNDISFVSNKSIDLFEEEGKAGVPKPLCSLVQWSCISYEDYVANQHSGFHMNFDASGSNYLFYRSVIVRGSAKMECFISVSGDFPADSPIWMIFIYWNGEHNSTNNTAVKALEFWTNNMHRNELKDGEFLMQAQLKRTMHSFDIFLETEAPLYRPSEYSKEKHFIKSFSKRSRTRPYKLLAGELFCSI